MTTSKPNTGFWIIGVIALIWNLLGVFSWVSQYFLMTEEMKAELPPEQLELMNSMPSWGMYVMGVAVIAAALACLLMLAKKKLAVSLFLISLLAALVLQGYWIFATNVVDVMGAEAIVMPLVVIAIAIFLYFYSKGAAQKGWLS